MERLLDFSDCVVNNLYTYRGANGSKIGIEFEESIYMLKFPVHIKGAQDYSNSVFSEYIGCRIFESLGFVVQECLLGVYKKDSTTLRNVVACKDFSANTDYDLIEFAELKNTIIDTSSNGYGTDLDEVLMTIDTQKLYAASKLKAFFWEMFIVDALLGNFDRHNGNWGFLINKKTKDVKIAPVFDCGSCLYPQLSEEAIADVLNNVDEIKKRVYIFPNSALRDSSKNKINYFEFLNNLNNEDCQKALLKIYPKIDLNKINQIIDNTPYITDLRKSFYKIMIKERYDKILTTSYKKIVESNKIPSFY